MFRSRRRSREFRFTEADMRLRAALGDAQIIAWYDARFPHTITLDTGVSAWADSRPASPGPSLVQTTDAAQPVYDGAARTITFDGTADYLRATSAAWNAITAACGISLVVTLPATAGSAEAMATLGVSTPANLLRLARAASSGNVTASADTDQNPIVGRAGGAGVRVVHGRRTASSGGSVTIGVQVVGLNTEATGSGTAADQTAANFTLGADQATTAAGFSDIVVRAALVLKGNVSAAMRSAIDQWARTVHAATV